VLNPPMGKKAGGDYHWSKFRINQQETKEVLNAKWSLSVLHSMSVVFAPTSHQPSVNFDR
jgi:hypothetical protein